MKHEIKLDVNILLYKHYVAKSEVTVKVVCIFNIWIVELT